MLSGENLTLSSRLRIRRTRYVEKLPARVLSITSGKGGVGKTHTSVNLSLTLTKQGKKVLLIDADMGLANVNILLGFETAATLGDVVAGKSSIDDVIVSHTLGFDIIPAASGVAELTRLSEDERQLLISSFQTFASTYDYIIIDTAAGIGGNVMYFNSAAEDVLVVVDPEPTSITDAYALIKVCSTDHGIQDFKVIANRVPAQKNGKDVYAQLAVATDKFLQVGLKYLGQVTRDDCVNQAVMEQRPYLDLYPGCEASLDIQKIASKLIKEEKSRSPKGGMHLFFEQMLS